MSARYPTGHSLGLLPNTVELIAPGDRNLYGEIATEGASITVRAKVVPSLVEMEERGGIKVKRQGAVVITPVIPGVEVPIGTLVRFQGVRYSVIAVYGRPDHTGQINYLSLTVVTKAGETD